MLLNILLVLVAMAAVLAYVKVERENGELRMDIVRARTDTEKADTNAKAQRERATYWRDAVRTANDATVAAQQEVAALLRAQARPLTFEDDDDPTEPLTVGEADKRAAQARFVPAAKRPERPTIGENQPEQHRNLDEAMAGIVPSGAPKAPRDV